MEVEPAMEVDLLILAERYAESRLSESKLKLSKRIKGTVFAQIQYSFDKPSIAEIMPRWHEGS